MRTFWVSMTNRMLRWMNIYEKTWVCKQEVNSVFHSKLFFFYLQKNFQGSFAFFLPGIPWNNNKFFVFRIRNFFSEKMSLLWSPDIRNSQSIPQCTILSYFEAFLMKSCKYIWSTLNTTKRKLWPKNSKDSRFKASRLLALREYVVFRVSVPEVFSLWMNQEMTQLGFASYLKMFMIISNIV